MGISKCDGCFSSINETQFWDRVMSFNNYSPDSTDNKLINALGKVRNVQQAVNFGNISEEDAGYLLTEHGELTEHLINNKKLSPKLEHDMIEINQLMKMLPSTNGTTLYRGVRNSVDRRFTDMLVNDFHKNSNILFKTSSYLSFSESPFIAKNYVIDSEGKMTKDGLLFVIEKSTDVPRAISFYSPNPSEAEVLYPLGKYFKLTNATYLQLSKGSIWRVQISEVEDINQYDNAMIFDFWGKPIRFLGGLL